MVKQLLKANANPNLQSSSGWSALHYTANSLEIGSRNQDAEIAQLLLDSNVNANLLNNSGYSALYVSVRNNRQEVLKTLLKSVSVDINTANKNGWTPLMEAVFDGNIAAVQALINAGADLNLKQKDGWTALHFTANKIENGKRTNDVKIAELLLKANANTELVNTSNNTPLYLAASNKRHDVLNTLIKYKANLNVSTENGVTPLMEAVFEGDLIAVKALVNAGANLNLQTNKGWAALHYTANALERGNRKQDAEIINVLLSKNPNLNLKTDAGYTPLHLSVANKRPEVRKPLLAKKANPNSHIVSNQWTPLMSAVYDGDIEAVKDLLKAGAKLDVRDDTGWTALHFTANSYEKGNRNKDAEIAKLLIDAKASLEITNHQGRTPFALALANNRRPVQDVLLRHGAEDTRYPARPQARPGYTTCNTRCNNGDCYRTYSDGRKLHFQAQQRYNPSSGSWEYDSGSC